MRPLAATRVVQTHAGAVNVAHLQKRLQQTEEQLAQARHQLLVLIHELVQSIVEFCKNFQLAALKPLPTRRFFFACRCNAFISPC